MFWFRRRSKPPSTNIAAGQRNSRFVWLGGRRHLADSPYLLPADIEETNRLDFQHYIIRFALRGNYLAPLREPNAILDVGAGTGRWAREMAQQFPKADVIAMDVISPAQPSFNDVAKNPDNYTFVQGNIFDPLPFADQSFDYSHIRFSFNAIPNKKLPELLQELIRVTKINGWIEVGVAISSAKDAPATQQISNWIEELLSRRGLENVTLQEIKRIFHESDVINIHDLDVELPIGAWGGRVGIMVERDITALYKSFSPVLANEGIAEPNAIQKTLDAWKVEVNQNHLTSPLFTIYGQRSSLEGVLLPDVEITQEETPNKSLDTEGHLQGDEASESLLFTAFHPKEVMVETWNSLLVYAHVFSALNKVREDAYQNQGKISETPRIEQARSLQPLKKGVNLTIIPRMQGVTFNPEKVDFQWREDWHRSDFRFIAEKSLAGYAGNGEIEIYAGIILVATVKMAILFNGDEDITSLNDNVKEVGSPPYNKIFVSYSHRDSDIVFAFRESYKGLGMVVNIDEESLKSGENFHTRILEMVRTSDIFQLFWSKNAAKSDYVTKEWKYALSCQKEQGFIRPVYWQKPMAPPPPELANMHFTYISLLKMQGIFRGFALRFKLMQRR